METVKYFETRDPLDVRWCLNSRGFRLSLRFGRNDASWKEFHNPEIVRYSDLSTRAGLMLAPFKICKLTVPSAISVKMTTGTTSRSQPRLIRNAKPPSHSLMPYHVNGRPITLAMSTSLRNCHDSSDMMLPTDAPSTLRMPISFSFCDVVNDAKPQSPRQ